MSMPMPMPKSAVPFLPIVLLWGMGWNEDGEWEWGQWGQGCGGWWGWHGWREYAKKNDDFKWVEHGDASAGSGRGSGDGMDGDVSSVDGNAPNCCILFPFWTEWRHDAGMKKKVSDELWKTTLDIDIWEWNMLL
jgi:hypothetical protein